MELPPVPFTVRAIAPYQPNSANELALVAGNVYGVTNTDGKGIWLQGQVDGVYGWFPLSYTEIIDNAAPLAQAPAPPASTQYVAPAQAQMQPISEPKTKETGAVHHPKKAAQKKKPSLATKFHIEKNKKGLSTTVVVHVIAAELNCDSKKTDATAWLFMKDYHSTDEGRRFESTEVARRTAEPAWNESFTMVVTDPESEVIVVRVVNGKTYDRKKLIGEVEFILRSSVRDYDSPDFQNKWYPLTLKDSAAGRRNRTSTAKPDTSAAECGRILICIQYIDTRQTGGPTDFKRISHIGWSAEGGFDISNIPPEWKALFKQVGIKKKDLKQNQDLAKDVFDIMNTAAQEDPAAIQEKESVVCVDIPAPPPMHQQPAVPGVPGMPSLPPTPTSVQHVVEEEIPEPTNDLLSAIRRGTQLTRVEVEERPVVSETGDGGGLSDLLRKAMAGRVKATSDEADEEEDDSDWSDD